MSFLLLAHECVVVCILVTCVAMYPHLMHYKKTMFFLTSGKTPIGVILNMGFVFLDVP